jgi:hypothetical protein
VAQLLLLLEWLLHVLLVLLSLTAVSLLLLWLLLRTLPEGKGLLLLLLLMWLQGLLCKLMLTVLMQALHSFLFTAAAAAAAVWH